MSHYSEPDIHIKDKVKVVLNLSSYGSNKELKDTRAIDTSNLAAKKTLFLCKLKWAN